MRFVGSVRWYTGCVMLLLGMSIGASAQSTWRRTYGGFGSDVGRSIRETPDGGFIVAGSTGSFGAGGGDVYLLKLDPDGGRSWSTTFGGPGADQGWSVASLPDGYVVTGFTAEGNGGYDGLLVRTGSDGSALWQRTYGGPDWDFLFGLEAVEDGYFLTGQTYTDTGAEAWLLRTDANGDTLWTRTFGTPYADEARTVRATTDGGCIVAGTLGNADGTTDAALVKFSNNGQEQWRTVLGGAGDDTGYGVTLTMDGGYVLGGSTKSFSTFSEMLMAKTNAAGDELWLKNTGQLADWEGREVRERANGGFLLVGYSEAFGAGGKDVYLLFTDAEGDYLSGRTYGGSEQEEGWSVDLTSDGGTVVAGENSSVGPGVRAVYVIKGDTAGNTIDPNDIPDFDPLSVRGARTTAQIVLFPMPAVPGTPLHIHLIHGGRIRQPKLIDHTGRVLRSFSDLTDGDVLPLPQLSAGTYFLRGDLPTGPASIPIILVPTD